MSTAELITGTDTLRMPAQAFFREHYQISAIHHATELHRSLGWIPSFRFTLHDHINVFVELSDASPYSSILRLRHPDVLQFPEPIMVYSVCPDDVALHHGNQKEIRDLQAHGYGLITVSSEGVAARKFPAVPLVQVITDAEFKSRLVGLTSRQKQKVAQSFEDYQGKPSVGVTSLTEVVEGVAIQALKEAAKKTWIDKKYATGAVAHGLDELYTCQQCRNARAAIGAVRGYIAQYRNLSHHWPKNKKKARERYAMCKMAFLQGMFHLQGFRDAMKNIGLSGNLPSA